jgi:murein DD-endopeptidase MepM/ murein hydrolase activator NlpD
MKRLGQSIIRASVSAIVISHLASCASAQSEDRKRAADANQAKLKDCSLYPSQHTSPYILPYEAGTEHLVWRGREHFVRGNGGVGLYAYDFEMPVGTKIVAARSGEVVALREEFDGVLVKKGDRVKLGQVVALSGNTGDTGGGAHLHFDVQHCGPNMPPHYNQLPCGQTLPITFRNTRPHRCGLVSNERYRASP